MDTKYYRNLLRSMNSEEADRKINNLREKEKLERWRAEILKRFREEHPGTFYPVVAV
jgi:hypothetical protein